MKHMFTTSSGFISSSIVIITFIPCCLKCFIFNESILVWTFSFVVIEFVTIIANNLFPFSFFFSPHSSFFWNKRLLWKPLYLLTRKTRSLSSSLLIFVELSSIVDFKAIWCFIFSSLLFLFFFSLLSWHDLTHRSSIFYRAPLMNLCWYLLYFLSTSSMSFNHSRET